MATSGEGAGDFWGGGVLGFGGWEGGAGGWRKGARETAKRAAENDAGVRGRDALVWSGSWSLWSGCGFGRGMDPYKDDFIRAWLGDRKANGGATANTTASANCKYNAGVTAGPFDCAQGRSFDSAVRAMC